MVTVRCPACLATYNLDPAKVGPELVTTGKKMKCAKCGTVWLAKPESEEALAVAAQAEAKAAAQRAADATAAPVSAAPSEKTAADSAPDSAPPAEPAPEAANEPVSAPLPEDALLSQGPSLDSMAHARRPGLRWLRGENRWALGAVLFVGIGIVMAGWVVLHRLHRSDTPNTLQLDAARPAAATTAPRAPATVNPPAGVLLRRVRSEISAIDGGVMLTVRGLVTNTTSKSVVLPPLMVQLLGADGSVQDMWPVSSISGTLPPQAENAWVVSLTEPSLDAVKGWRVVFTDAQPGGK